MVKRKEKKMQKQKHARKEKQMFYGNLDKGPRLKACRCGSLSLWSLLGPTLIS
jgi:hypothetical protein